jgi:hypothetical protein
LEDAEKANVVAVLAAESLTLLHERYHYVATHDKGNEEKAFAIST